MKMKFRTLYHRKSITEINTLQCLHENEVHVSNEVQNIVSHEKHEKQQKLIHCNVFMKMKYRKLYHMKIIKEMNTLQCLHENKYGTMYHFKSITEINIHMSPWK